jgi:hypothetical protein
MGRKGKEDATLWFGYIAGMPHEHMPTQGIIPCQERFVYADDSQKCLLLKGIR